MQLTDLKNIATLRMVVGYLGEREQCGWWQSSFLSASSQAFLAPLFARTQLQAQCNGVTGAASLVHDARIGVGNVYHLFRLPEGMEQGIHRELHDSDLAEHITGAVRERVIALEHLRTMANLPTEMGIGPTRIGATNDLDNPTAWRNVASQYLLAFENGSEVYPYFSDSTP